MYILLVNLPECNVPAFQDQSKRSGTAKSFECNWNRLLLLY